MIPKKLHYCWFGRGKKPHLIRHCLATWRQVMPDYEIKEWNEDNFDVTLIPFVKQAYMERKWAFVADYCRFYACHKEGGIYLDTDVEVFRRFDDFLHHHFFAGTELRPTDTEGDFITLDASAFGCEQGHWYAQACMDFYHDKPFRLSDGRIPGGVVQVVATRVLEPYGYRRINERQVVKDIDVYPTSFFCNKSNRYNKKTIYSLHHFDGSWTDVSGRGRLFAFCRKYDLMHIYRAIERFISKFR